MKRVVGCISQIGESDPCNEGLTQLSKLIEDVAYRDQQVRLTEEFDVKTLLPSQTLLSNRVLYHRI